MPTPPAHACPDPLEAACGWNCPGGFRLAVVGDELQAGCLLSCAQDEQVEPLPGVHLEVRCSHPASWSPQARSTGWSLWLDYVVPGESDDLLLLEEVLERARLAGCNRVVAPGWPASAERDHRYRWFSLVRLLCDVRKLPFSLCELEPIEPSDRLNPYLASARGCCRHPAHRPPLRR